MVHTYQQPSYDVRRSDSEMFSLNPLFSFCLKEDTIQENKTVQDIPRRSSASHKYEKAW